MSAIRIKDTPQVRATFTALWNAVPRVTTVQIGAAMGVSRKAVSIYAKRLGLTPRSPGTKAARGTLLGNPGAEDLFARLWQAGVANREILRALGATNHPANVSQAAAVRGLQRRPRNFRGLTIEEWRMREGMALAATAENRAAAERWRQVA